MSDTNVWKAEAESTIYQIDEYKKTLVNLMSNSDDITLDLSAIKEVDVCFLQLLIAIQITATNQSININIVVGASDVVINLAQSSHCMAALAARQEDVNHVD